MRRPDNWWRVIGLGLNFVGGMMIILYSITVISIIDYREIQLTTGISPCSTP
jgi:hypothetical protein